MEFATRPLPVGPETPFTASQIRDVIQQILATEGLPAIVQVGHPVIRQHAARFDGQIDDTELVQLIERMRDVMHAAPGVGLAAPQLGIPLQLAVLEDRFDVDPIASEARQRTPLGFFPILNPTYEPTSPSTASFYEGCLSMRGFQAVVTRHRDVRLSYQRPDGSTAAEEFTGWQARIVQHETDHLHGGIYLDRAELRSLSNDGEYRTNWAYPGIEEARHGLGFLDS
ncbi:MULTISPECIES: peptide deformylase [Arthrobacter]|uniref:Peptide deformylase n=1 Tax=Arthrobacter terricola TaxID=2547396 RepID=A0A4R5KCN4_9MICC|nr:MULTISPECIES: peptide deformylase [Arthrobacter]MBT8162885.1 peptide deformylase [Arthrobacter sp. GN70]TDF91887.1 peptide deformylase [Arthrobacter terricola]